MEMQYDEDMGQLMPFVDKMMEDRERIGTVYTIMSKPKKAARVSCDDGDDVDKPWPTQYTHWCKIPQYWKIAWLAKHHSFLTPDYLHMLRSNGGRPNILNECFEHETGIKDSDGVPPAIHYTAVMATVLGFAQPDERPEGEGLPP